MQFSFSQHSNGIYQGLFLESLKEGVGIFIWHSGQIYIGEWKNDKINGIGLFIFNPSEYLHSYFKDGKSDKFGVLRMMTNNVFFGEWENGKLGKKFKYFFSKENNTFTFEDETIIEEKNGFPNKNSIYPSDYDYKLYNLESIFKKYKSILKEFNQEISIIKISSESVYIGFCQNNTPEGLGILKNKNGVQIYGHFKNGISNSISFTHLPTGKVFFGKSVCGIYSEKMIYYDNDWRKYIYAVCNEYGVPILTLKESDSIKDLKKERKETFENAIFSLKPQRKDEKISKKLLFLPDFDKINMCLNEFELKKNNNVKVTQPSNGKKEKITKQRKSTEDKNNSSTTSVTNIYKGANIYNKILKKEIDVSNLSRTVNPRKLTSKSIKNEMNKKIIPENISDISYRSSERDKDCKEQYEDSVNIIEVNKEKNEQIQNIGIETKIENKKEKVVKKNGNWESKIKSEEKPIEKKQYLLLQPNSKKCEFSSPLSSNKVIIDTQHDTLQHCYLDLGVTKNDLYNLLISNINQKQQ